MVKPNEEPASDRVTATANDEVDGSDVAPVLVNRLLLPRQRWRYLDGLTGSSNPVGVASIRNPQSATFTDSARKEYGGIMRRDKAFPHGLRANGTFRKLCGVRSLGNPPQLYSYSVSCNTMATTGEELTVLIEAKGQEIRALKTEGVPKDTLKPHIDELLVLKAKFKSMTGAAYVAPGQEKSKPAASPPAPPTGGAEAADPNKKSKKQLQREKKEAEKAVAKAKAKEERERKHAEAGARGATQEMCVKRALTRSTNI